MPEEIQPGITTVTPAAVTETPATTPPVSSADILKQAADVDARLRGETPVPPVTPESQPATVTSEPAKLETVPFDIGAELKKVGFGEDNLEGVKRHLDVLMARDETFHWLSKNVSGFTDWATRQIMRGKGVLDSDPNDTLETLAKPKAITSETSKQTAVDRSALRTKMADVVNPLTGEKFSPEEVDAQIGGFELMFDAIAAERGYVRHDDLKARDEQSAAEKAEQKAYEAWDSFSENPNIKAQLEKMGLDFTKDVKVHLARKLAVDYGITNPALITPKRIAEAWNSFVISRHGGLDQLLTNAKTEAIQSQADKEAQLPKPVTQPGAPVAIPGKRETIDDIINNPDPDPVKQQQRVLAYAAQFESRRRGR